jgi:hypothetical protein
VACGKRFRITKKEVKCMAAKKKAVKKAAKKAVKKAVKKKARK